MSTRTIQGREVEFGTAGYTLNDVFVLYDRATESVWYPGEAETLDAVAGEQLGTSIPFLDEPDPQPLSAWLVEHPDSQVLLPSEADWLAAKRPRIGLRFTDRDDALEVRRVVDEGPGAEVGIAKGDLILSLAGEAVTDSEQLRAILDRHSGGDAVEVVYERDGERTTATLVLMPPRG